MASFEGSKPKNMHERPYDAVRNVAFQQVLSYLENHDEEQLTIHGLITEMGKLLGPEYSPYERKTMKKKLRDYYGDNIVISPGSDGKDNVTLIWTVKTILKQYFSKPRNESDEEEKMRLVSLVGKLLKNDFKQIKVNNGNYPTTEDMKLEAALRFLPSSIKCLLSNILVGDDTNRKMASIGQALVQASRPRSLIAPLQLGFGIQMHHHFASRFLLDSLHNHGFCSSYTQVKDYEKCAAASSIDIHGWIPGRFKQWIGDNVDHNPDTLDGKNSIHVMGLIKSVTPKVEAVRSVAKSKVTYDEISKLGKIDIKFYEPKEDRFSNVVYETIRGPVYEMREITKVDNLWKIMWPLRNPRPNWSGTMQFVYRRFTHPGESSLIFLPFINLNPSDMSCIYTTLDFVDRDARKYNVTPIVTFDQPLYLKAVEIVTNSPELGDMVLTLGGLHTVMSFLGTIGHLMAGTGLEEAFECIYAAGSTAKMLNGKATSKALRAHFLLDTTLNTIIMSKIYGTSTDEPPRGGNCVSPKNEATTVTSKDSFAATSEPDTSILPELLPDKGMMDDYDIPVLSHTPAFSQSVYRDLDSSDMGDIEEVKKLFNTLMSGECSVEQVFSSNALSRIESRMAEFKSSMNDQRTSTIWFMYQELIDIFRMYLRAERSGNWNLRLHALKLMLPYFAASGHNLYAKSAYIYVQKMANLAETHPVVHAQFLQGLHVIRRSDRLWAGLSTDLVIEQCLMRALKSTGGLTRGRGMDEKQATIWLLSRPATAEVNLAMENYAGTFYSTSDQHVDFSEARLKRDSDDIRKVIIYFAQRDPFSKNDGQLHNIYTGVVADDRVNVDNALVVGSKILDNMKDQKIKEFSFKKSSRVVTMATQLKNVRVGIETIQIDPMLLFQRSTTSAQINVENMATVFQFELCTYPPALFDRFGLPNVATKANLADSIWKITASEQPSSLINEDSESVHYVIDGGYFMYKVEWNKGESYSTLCNRYYRYLQKHYNKNVTIVFDGYDTGPSPKDTAHKRRSGGNCSRTVVVEPHGILDMKREEFLRNLKNKSSFIKLLRLHLEHGYDTFQADGDADFMIATKAIDIASTSPTVLIGEDTVLLVLLCCHSPESHRVYFKSEEKRNAKKASRIWSIQSTKKKLGNEVYNRLLFLHAYLGCDTCSRIHGIGKGLAVTKCIKDAKFRKLCDVFNKPNQSREALIEAGNNILVSFYGGVTTETLNYLRYRKFTAKVVRSLTAVEPQSLPPTEAAAKWHYTRVYWQVQTWKGQILNPLEWGFKLVGGDMIAIMTENAPAPESLLRMIKCDCKHGCTGRCTCRRHGMKCTSACGIYFNTQI